jgi:hypothetical protein
MIDRVWLCGRNQSIRDIRIPEAETTVATGKNISTIAKLVVECFEMKTPKSNPDQIELLEQTNIRIKK